MKIVYCVLIFSALYTNVLTKRSYKNKASTNSIQSSESSYNSNNDGSSYSVGSSFRTSGSSASGILDKESSESKGIYDSSDGNLDRENRFFGIRQMIEYLTNSQKNDDEIELRAEDEESETTQELHEKLKQTIKDKNACFEELLNAQEQMGEILGQYDDYQVSRKELEGKVRSLKITVRDLEKSKIMLERRVIALEQEKLYLLKRNKTNRENNREKNRQKQASKEDTTSFSVCKYLETRVSELEDENEKLRQRYKAL